MLIKSLWKVTGDSNIQAERITGDDVDAGLFHEDTKRKISPFYFYLRFNLQSKRRFNKNLILKNVVSTEL